MSSRPHSFTPSSLDYGVGDCDVSNFHVPFSLTSVTFERIGGTVLLPTTICTSALAVEPLVPMCRSLLAIVQSPQSFQRSRSSMRTVHGSWIHRSHRLRNPGMMG